jgi:hypothetical protein
MHPLSAHAITKLCCTLQDQDSSARPNHADTQRGARKSTTNDHQVMGHVISLPGRPTLKSTARMQDILKLIAPDVRPFWKADQGFNPSSHVFLSRITQRDDNHHAIGV